MSQVPVRGDFGALPLPSKGCGGQMNMMAYAFMEGETEEDKWT